MKRLDFTVIIGLIVGVVAICGGAMLEGIKFGFLWQPTAAIVVIGGTIGAIIVRRGFSGLNSSLRAALSLFSTEDRDESAAALARLTWLARQAKREGVKVFESHARTSRDPLVICALTLASEYADAGVVRVALNRILDNEDEKGMREASTLDAAGGYAPTFGIIGAVLGLIHVLRSLAEPSVLGLGIATAFVATIYGVGLANLILFPLGSRLRERHLAHMKQREALADALVALASNESPSAIASHFSAHLTTDAHNHTNLMSVRKALAQ